MPDLITFGSKAILDQTFFDLMSPTSDLALLDPVLPMLDPTIPDPALLDPISLMPDPALVWVQ